MKKTVMFIIFALLICVVFGFSAACSSDITKNENPVDVVDEIGDIDDTAEETDGGDIPTNGGAKEEEQVNGSSDNESEDNDTPDHYENETWSPWSNI